MTQVFVMGLLLLGLPANAGWMAHGDFASCPRKYVPNTSAKEGPFGTESECNARVEKVKRDSPMVCARYTCVNEGGTSSGGTTATGAAPMDPHIQNAISAGMNGQISSGDAMGLVGLGLLGNAMLAQPTAAELEARRQQEWAAERARVAAEIERQRQIKEHNDKMDAEAVGTLGLLEPTLASNVSDEDLLKSAPPPVKPFDCKENGALVARLEVEGLKRLDINIGKTRKMIKQAEEGKGTADRELAVIAGEAVAGKLADAMKDFVTNQKTIVAMEKQLHKLTAGTSVMNADKAKLEAWLKNGLEASSLVIDTYDVAKKAKAVNFSDPKNASRKAQMLAALTEFNTKFMNDTGAWELAGEKLAAGLGPAGPAAFKTAVLGINVAANRGDKMLSENDLNEQKYHLGNMQKTRSEMAQKIKDLKKEIKEKCNS